jgi:hypothetical protein
MSSVLMSRSFMPRYYQMYPLRSSIGALSGRMGYVPAHAETRDLLRLAWQMQVLRPRARGDPSKLLSAERENASPATRYGSGETVDLAPAPGRRRKSAPKRRYKRSMLWRGQTGAVARQPGTEAPA